MDTIRTYLDNVFAAFQQTEQVQNLKHDMQASMEEKYLFLRQQGKSEHEALGTIIANFGSVDEIAAALGMKPEGQVSTPDAQVNSKDWINTSYEGARDYLAHHNRYSRWMGFGIWLIFIGAAALNWFGGLTLIVSIVVAIPIIIVSFVKMHYYAGFSNKNALLDDDSYAELAHDYARLRPQYVVRGIFSVGIILLAIWAANSLANTNLFVIPIIGFALFLHIPVWVARIVYEFFLRTGSFYFKNGKTAIHSTKRITIDISIAVLYGAIAGGVFANYVVSSTAAVGWFIFPLQFVLTDLTTHIVSWFITEKKSEHSNGLLQ